MHPGFSSLAGALETQWLQTNKLSNRRKRQIQMASVGPTPCSGLKSDIASPIYLGGGGKKNQTRFLDTSLRGPRANRRSFLLARSVRAALFGGALRRERQTRCVRPDLLHQAEHVPVNMALRKLAARQRVDVNARERDLALCRRDAHERRAVRTGRFPSGDNLIAGGNLLNDLVL